MYTSIYLVCFKLILRVMFQERATVESKKKNVFKKAVEHMSIYSIIHLARKIQMSHYLITTQQYFLNICYKLQFQKSSQNMFLVNKRNCLPFSRCSSMHPSVHLEALLYTYLKCDRCHYKTKAVFLYQRVTFISIFVLMFPFNFVLLSNSTTRKRSFVSINGLIII